MSISKIALYYDKITDSIGYEYRSTFMTSVSAHKVCNFCDVLLKLDLYDE